MADSTPRHLRPEACYVCGGDPHGADFDRTGKGHNYWSVAAAEAAEAADTSDGPTWADGVFAEEKPWPEVTG